MRKAVVFIPALLCDERLYNHQIKTLEALFDVFVFTLKDFTNIHSAAKFIIEKMNNRSFYLVGTSMGGYVAMEIMRQCKKMIMGLCLINTTYYEDSLEKKQQRLQQIKDVSQLSSDNFSAINDANITLYIRNTTKENTELIKDMTKSLGKEVFINQQRMILSRSSSVEDFKSYDVDTLIIGSTYDTITPALLHREMAANIKHAKVSIIDNAAHLSPIDQKEAVSVLLKYWLDGF